MKILILLSLLTSLNPYCLSKDVDISSLIKTNNNFWTHNSQNPFGYYCILKIKIEKKYYFCLKNPSNRASSINHFLFGGIVYEKLEDLLRDYRLHGNNYKLHFSKKEQVRCNYKFIEISHITKNDIIQAVKNLAVGS